MTDLSRIAFSVVAGLFAGVLACTGSDGGGSGGSDDGQSCQHGEYYECSCTDGSVGMQLCAHDTSGFEECVCGGNETGGSMDASAGSMSATTSTSASTTVGESSSADGSSSDASTTTGVGSSDSSGESGPVGSVPTTDIFHPSNGEERTVGVPIPFIGQASDMEDGVLGGASMIWTSDLEGEIGQGQMFDAALTMEGTHTITLTATDSDNNVAEDSITLELVP